MIGCWLQEGKGSGGTRRGGTRGVGGIKLGRELKHNFGSVSGFKAGDGPCQCFGADF